MSEILEKLETENELYPCRFCGSFPTLKQIEDRFGIVFGIMCDKCFHMASPHYMRDINRLKEAWQARNEKHNPFIEEK